MGIVQVIGRVISAAANLMACVQGVCFGPGKQSDLSIQNTEYFGPFQRGRERVEPKDRDINPPITGRDQP